MEILIEKNYKNVIRAGIVLIFALILIIMVQAMQLKSAREAAVDLDSAAAENGTDEIAGGAAEDELPELEMPHGVDNIDVHTASSIVSIGSTRIVEFSDMAGKSLAFFAYDDGVIRTAEFCRLLGSPTVINYSDDDEDFLMPTGEVIGTICVHGKTFQLNADQYNLLTGMFDNSGKHHDYLRDTELGKFGYYEDGLVALESYLEDNGLSPDEDGVYWASPEGKWPREGVKLEVATTETDGEEVKYVQPTFYVVDMEYNPDEGDYTYTTKDWQPSTDQCLEICPDDIATAEVDGEFASVNYDVLEGIMQMVQRGDERNTYCHLDPGHMAISSYSTLYYQEAYDKEDE